MKRSEKLKKSIEAASRKAEKVLQKEAEIDKVIDKAVRKANDQSNKIGSFWHDLRVLLSMLGAYRRGEYRLIPWKSLVLIVAAIIYFLNPLDVIPDVIAGFGFVDDATVVGLVINAVKDEIARFDAHRQRIDSATPQTSNTAS